MSKRSSMVVVLVLLMAAAAESRGQGEPTIEALRQEMESALTTIRAQIGDSTGSVEARRASQSLERAAQRTQALTTRNPPLPAIRLGRDLDALFEEAVVTTWDVHLADARRAVERLQSEVDRETDALAREWTSAVDAIATREGLSAAARQALIDQAAAPVRAKENRILGTATSGLDAIATRLASARQRLQTLVAARAESARAAARFGAPERLSAIVEEHFESVGANAAGGSSFDAFVASATIRLRPIADRDGPQQMGLAERLAAVLARGVESDVPPNRLVPASPPRPRILAATVLRGPSDYPFPFDEPPGGDVERWTLFVLGRDLLQTRDGQRVPGIDYQPRFVALGAPADAKPLPRVFGGTGVSYSTRLAAHGVQTADDELLQEGFEKTWFAVDVDEPIVGPALDGLIVIAYANRGLVPGFRTFSIGPARGEWLLHPGTLTGTVRALRVVSEPRNEFDYLRDAFTPDRIQFELTLPRAIEEDEARLALFRNGDPIAPGGDPVVLARRMPRQPNVYRTPPIFIRGESTPHPDARPGDLQITCRPGDTLVAISSEPWFQAPPVERVAVHLTPASIRLDGASVLWKDALREAATLWDRTVADWDRLTSAEADSFTSIYVLQLDWHTTRFTIADHAAMLLLRRQFVAMAQEQKADFERILADDGLLWGYFRDLQPAMDAVIARPSTRFPLAGVEVREPNSPRAGLPSERRTVPFRRAFDYAYLREQFRGLEALRRDWQREAARQAVSQQVRWLDEAIARARAIGAKDLEALVNLTGDTFEPVIERALPQMVRLVESRNSANTPVAARWAPDPGARQALVRIRSIMAELGTARKAAREDTEALLAFATAALMHPTALLSKIILAASTAGSIATAVSDINAQDGYAAERTFARGAAPVIGYDRLNVALAARRTASWVPYATLVASFIGLHFDIGDLALGIRLSLAYRTADKVVDSIERAGLRSLRYASEDEVKAFLVAAEDARLARESGSALTPAQNRVIAAADRVETEALTAARADFPDEAPAHWFAATGDVGPEELASAQREATGVLDELSTSGLAGLVKINPSQKRSLATAVADAQAARAAGKPLSADQRKILDATETLEKKAIAEGLDVTEVLPVRPSAAALEATAFHPPPAAAARLEKRPPEGFPEPGSPFFVTGMKGPLQLGNYRGGGYFSAVYDSLDQPGKVVKLVRLPAGEPGTLTDILRRMQSGADLLARFPDDIPQLATRSIAQHGDWGIVAQDALPAEWKLLAEIPREAAFEAGFELYGKLRARQIAWWDGHLGNMFFIPRADGRYVAGILDPDMCLLPGQAAGGAAMARRMVGIQDLGGITKLFKERTIFSLDALNPSMRRAYDAWENPDAALVMRWTIDEFTLHMLERWGYIKFVRTSQAELRAGTARRGYWSDGMIRMDRVRELIGDPDQYVRFGDHIVSPRVPDESPAVHLLDRVERWVAGWRPFEMTGLNTLCWQCAP